MVTALLVTAVRRIGTAWVQQIPALAHLTSVNEPSPPSQPAKMGEPWDGTFLKSTQTTTLKWSPLPSEHVGDPLISLELDHTRIL